MKLDVAKTCKNCKLAHFNGAQRFGICTFVADGVHPPYEKNLHFMLKAHYLRTGDIMPLEDLLGNLTNPSWLNNRTGDHERFVVWVKWHEEFDGVVHRINAGNVCDEWIENKRASQTARAVVAKFNKN